MGLLRHQLLSFECAVFFRRVMPQYGYNHADIQVLANSEQQRLGLLLAVISWQGDQNNRWQKYQADRFQLKI